MALAHSTTTPRSFTHLSDTERGEISAYKKIGLSLRAIASKTGRDVSTISREIKRGSVTQLETDRRVVTKYFPDVGARLYQENRQRCGAPSVIMKSWDFLRFAEEKILVDHWSPDAAVGFAQRTSAFQETFIPCTKTLYNWIDQGKMKVINLDLAMKLRRSTKKGKPRVNKRILGDSIDLRPDTVESREEFGHWEIDTVIGQKSNDDALLTLIERKTRKEVMIRLPAKDSDSVTSAVKVILLSYGDRMSHVFKSITADNGSEFSDLAELGTDKEISVYFSHPYASYERGTNEPHNGRIRQFIKKGQPIHTYSDEKIEQVESWLNQLPRKILDYLTPDEAFAQCLDSVA
jgi:transposase, IS30 family